MTEFAVVDNYVDSVENTQNAVEKEIKSENSKIRLLNIGMIFCHICKFTGAVTVDLL